MRRNILVIIADQLSQKALGCYGNPCGHTPALDALAARGARFSNVYTTCPLCAPARASIWTGLLPHTTGIVSNGREYPCRDLAEDVPTLGGIFRAGGYETVHFGKKHDSDSLRGFGSAPEAETPVEGCECWPVDYDTRRDAYTVEKAVEYLSRPHERPFLAVADIQNPHDICNWVGAFAGPHEDLPVPGTLPELPDNFEVEDFENRPLPVQYICCSHNRLAQAAPWSRENYRHYLAAYYHFVGRADDAVRAILGALSASRAADDTLVVFLSDHGDGMAAHRLVTKQVSFQEETTRVPLVFAGPGIDGAGRVVSEALISVADLLPTLCEYAGLASPDGIYGRSLVPWLAGLAARDWRDFVVSEWVSEWGFTIEPGRMVRTGRFKYTRYLEGRGEELFDLESDPGERRSLAGDAAFAGVLEAHRRILEKHVEHTGDPFESLPVKADARWRTHAPGYQHHTGPAAPEAADTQA